MSIRKKFLHTGPLTCHLGLFFGYPEAFITSWLQFLGCDVILVEAICTVHFCFSNKAILRALHNEKKNIMSKKHYISRKLKNGQKGF